uniref:tRNA-dihydrouridine synthase n=1 Tax=Rhizophora mucronata TaxID=61149 RepID=A0A2P2LES0_RHIMU
MPNLEMVCGSARLMLLSRVARQSNPSSRKLLLQFPTVSWIHPLARHRPVVKISSLMSASYGQLHTKQENYKM